MLTALQDLIYALGEIITPANPIIHPVLAELSQFYRLRLLTELSQVPVPLPRIAPGSSQRILEFGEAVDQQGGPAGQDRRWPRIAHDRGVVCKYPK